MTYLELKQKHQKEFNEFPMFFAFNQKQFDEGMKTLGLKPNQTNKVYSFDGGGFYRKSDSTTLIEMLKRFDREEKEAMKDDNYVLEMFEYEMGNHEYGYTHSDMKVLDACSIDVDEFENNARLKKLYNQAQKSFLKKCDENNWY